MPPVQAVNTTYEPFSQQPEYIEANREFVRRQDFSGVSRLLDLACGTGLVSSMMLELNPTAHLNGIDYDPVQIELATKYLSGLGYHVIHGFVLNDKVENGKPVVTLGVCSADAVPLPDASFDCVTIANAIHMLPDKSKFLATVARLLKPGGTFGFNSSFYAGTYADGTEEHYYLWIKKATQYIDRLNAERESRGEEKIRRSRGKSHAAFQNKWFSQAEWVSMLADAGLYAHDINVRPVPLNERCLVAVAAYGGLSEVLLSGYPVEISSEALQATAKESLEALNTTAVPRNYLEVWATKE